MLRSLSTLAKNCKSKNLFIFNLIGNKFNIRSKISDLLIMEGCKNNECLTNQDKLLSKKYYRRAEHR